MSTALIPPPLLARLDALQLAFLRRTGGQNPGERPSPRRGPGLEFADYRAYAPGDDVRQVDWHAYARTDRLYVRLYSEEREATVYLVVDGTGSMDWGQPSKFLLAAQLAGALGYLALAAYDRVVAAVLTGRGWRRLGPLRGRQAAPALWQFLAATEPGGAADLGGALRALGAGRGLAVAISDWLGPPAWWEALGAYHAAGGDLAVIQVLAQDELDPQLEGDLRLVDRETGVGRDVSLSARILAEYRRRLQDHLAALDGWCARRGVRCARVPAHMPAEEALLGPLAAAGLVRARG